ncbi:MAG: RluA family pseudouridine synthase [candidate division Zixibacteria bacterium]
MSTSAELKKINTEELSRPQRLDKYLASREDLELSRAYIQNLISSNYVRVNDKTVSKNYKLKGGETIVIQIPPPEKLDLTPVDIPLDIVYDDEHLAVVNKPAGLVVHPGAGNKSHTLVNALLYHFKGLSDHDSFNRPGIIHRLDKDTSGLIVIAKDDLSARRLREQFAAREVEKIYHAITCGHMPEEEGTIELPIGRSLRDRKKMAVTNLKSRNAITHYRVLKRFWINDYVEIRLETGRTHQIRVHLAHFNRPVLGDPDYGGGQKWLKGIDPSHRKTGKHLLSLIDRQALHAKSLEFIHPIMNKKIFVSSNLPEDMDRLLKYLREFCAA